MRRIGLAFPGQPYSTRQIISAAHAAEASGFHSVWLAEDLWTGRDAISVLSCLALSTERIRIGPGVVNPYTRHPVLIAMTLNTLSDLAAGRLLLGIASGLPWKPFVAREMTQWPPLRAVRETVELVRTLLAGGKATWREETVSLAVSRQCFNGAIGPATGGIPVYIGATGPRMAQLVGEIGDGLILGTGTRPDEIPPILEQMAVGASRVQRDIKSIDVATIIVISASDDGRVDENTLGYATKQVAALDEAAVQRLGFDPERARRIKDEYQQGNCRSAYRLLSSDMVSAFVAAGTPDDCLRTIERFAQSGVHLPILLPFGGDVNGIIQVGVEYLRRAENKADLA
jgi:5,10-methylenetetrahydromethanopterin reductase